MHETKAIDALTAKVNELARICTDLSRENDGLRRQVSRLSASVVPTADQTPRVAAHAPSSGTSDSGWQAEADEAARISRRAAVGVALAGAAAGIVGTAALSERDRRSAATSAEQTAVTTELTAAGQVASGPTASGSVVNATLSTASAVLAGTNTSTGPGVSGTNTGAGAGVAAVNAAAGPGVHATSGRGRGGIFAGAAAQIQLTPAGASHPRSGQRGDLYADANGRLWFCKKSGATATWHQIA